ncbi:MAG: ABC transporter permease subunit [Candidatus Eremiobacteraeota bacterium]|nr:ABC transporter permease subunit [Candidatus Eremiobacteraeota bacterium]
MPQYWERLFIVAARLCIWLVALVPLLSLLVFIATFFYGRHGDLTADSVRTLAAQLLVTLLVATVATLIGATLGIGAAMFSHALTRRVLARMVRLHAKFLAAVPAVVLGWYGVALLSDRVTTAGVLLIVAAAVTLAVLPDAYIYTVRVVRALPSELLESAAALGANAVQTTTQVVLPGSVGRLLGIYAAVFARALPEAVAASVIFLAAARAGYPVNLFSLPAALIAQGAALRPIDAAMPVAAIAVMGMSLGARFLAARRIGALEWV